MHDMYSNSDRGYTRWQRNMKSRQRLLRNVEFFRAVRSLGVCLAAVACSSLRLPPRAADLAKARSLLMHGRYEEAAEIYKPEAAANAQAALGWAACLESQGKTAAAVEALKPLADKQAEIQAQLARLAFERGDSAEARRRAEEALQLASEHPLALYVLGELARTSGRLDEAEEHYRRLISFYNSHDVKKAESLRWIGRAAAQYARWNRLSDQFDFLVNDLFPSANEARSGLLARPLRGRAALHGEVQSGRCRQGVPGGPGNQSPRGRGPCRPGRTGDGRLPTRSGRGLAPPGDGNQSPLARRLAAQGRRGLAQRSDRRGPAAAPRETPAPESARRSRRWRGSPLATWCWTPPPGQPERSKGPSRFDALAAEVAKRNPHAGEFYAELAEMLQIRNRHAAAERYFREAIRLLPRQPEPHAGLGLLLMRMGREADARTLLKEAFDADPFHVRVKNSLDVLDVIDAMQTRTTPHFVIKYDKADARLIPYLARSRGLSASQASALLQQQDGTCRRDRSRRCLVRFPYDEDGKPIAQLRVNFPTLTLYVKWNKQKIPLCRWRTAIGSWRSEMHPNGKVYFKYKNSDVGLRVWKDIVAGPVWIPPEGTPVKDLLTRKTWDRDLGAEAVVNTDVMGPGFQLAYGLVMAIHHWKRGKTFFDNQIRTDGSVDYTSIARRYSHGCHRLVNSRAVRLFDFILRHRVFHRVGNQPITLRRHFEYEGRTYHYALGTRRYYYELDPPVPVMVTEGRIMGKVKKPIEAYLPKPGVDYGPSDESGESTPDVGP